MSRMTTWLLAALLLGVFVAVVGYVVRERARAGVGLPAYSVYSKEAEGMSEAGYVLGRLGWTPVAVTRPLQNTDHRGLLIVVEAETGNPFQQDLEPQRDSEAVGILNWVAAGNTLLLCGRSDTNLHELLGVRPSGKAAVRSDKVEAVRLGQGGVYFDDVVRISADTRAVLSAPRGLPLWSGPDGVGAVLLAHGKGRVIAVADPGVFTNRGLGRDDNVIFLRNVAELHARDRTVYFDEYHHGFRSEGGFWGYLGHYGQRLALLPLLIVMAVVAWRWLVRLGPAVPTPRTEQADAVDYASALARLYQRAGTRRLLARTLARGFLGALTKHLHLRRNALPAEVLAAWGEYDAGPSMERLKGLLRGIAELRKGEVKERQLLNWTRAFDEFQKTQILNPKSQIPNPKSETGRSATA
jgi:hypothetical protein